MKTIIAGSRCICDAEVLKAAIAESGFSITKVISGDARGVDKLGIEWARANGVPVERFKPQWIGSDGEYRPYAGNTRNRDMARVAEALVAVWDGRTKGTKDMIKQAQHFGLKVFVKLIEVPDVDLTEQPQNVQSPTNVHG